MDNKLFEWDEKLETGIPIIDSQHQNLVAMINYLYANMGSLSKDKLLDVIIKLIDYTNYHFGTEEEYFLRFGYEHTEEHINRHKEFVDKVKAFYEEYSKNDADLTFDIMLFLSDWIVEHILYEDHKYVDLFLAKGVDKIEPVKVNKDLSKE